MADSSESVLQILAEVGAIITESHVVYTSGRHGAVYVNKDALYLHPQATARVCDVMAQTYPADEIDVVVGPTVGGVILAQWVAHHLSNAQRSGEVLAAYAEEVVENGAKSRVFRRGYDAFVRDKRVVVVEDVVTTGGTVRNVIDAVRALGATISGVSVLCNRGGLTGSDLGDVALHALTTIPQESWDAAACPLCAQGVPINTTVGKGAAFLAQQRGL
jgi:orotate phosphoribosyltransferase